MAELWALELHKNNDRLAPRIFDIYKIAKILGMSIPVTVNLMKSCGGTIDWCQDSPLNIFYNENDVKRFITEIGEERKLMTKMCGYDMGVFLIQD